MESRSNESRGFSNYYTSYCSESRGSESRGSENSKNKKTTCKKPSKSYTTKKTESLCTTGGEYTSYSEVENTEDEKNCGNGTTLESSTTPNLKQVMVKKASSEISTSNESCTWNSNKPESALDTDTGNANTGSHYINSSLMGAMYTFLLSSDLSKLHSNQKIILLEMLSRGIQLEIIDLEKEIVKATLGNHVEYLYDRDSSIVPYNMSILAGDKWQTKKILQANGISIPRGIACNISDDLNLCMIYKQFMGAVTVKPTFGSHGYDVYLNICNENDYVSACAKIREHLGENTQVLIEEYFPAKEYRVFITKNGDYAVLEREPAYVYGDGVHTIKELVEIDNTYRMNPRKYAWCNILLDDVAEHYLHEQHKSIDTIPNQYEKVYVRPNSNVAMGGIPIDRTDEVHPSVIDICKKTLQAFSGLPYIGIDFLTQDISKPQSADSYRIIEVNTIPGVDMHFRPVFGKSRNIGKYMVDLIFPETVK